MGANKIIVKVDGVQTDQIDFNSAVSGLSTGSHTITVEAYDGVTLLHTQTRNVTVASTNIAPSATTDSYNTNQDTVLNVDVVSGVLANDSDADGQPLTAVLVTTTTNGTLTLNSDGSFTYTPAAAYIGSDSFVYKAYDGESYSADVTVTLNVTEVTVSPESIYQEVLNYATSVSAPHPSTAQQDADKQLIADLQASGAWDKADVFINYGGTADIAFRRICWKRLLQIDVFGSVIWSADGIEGNATNGYVNTKFNPSIDGVNFTLYDAGILACIGKNVAGSNTSPKPIIGGYSGSTTGYTMFVPRQTGGGGGTYYILNGGVWAESINTIGQIGLNGLYREGGSVTARGNGEVSKVVNPDGMFNSELYMLARNSQETATLFSDERIKYLYLGAALTETEHNALTSILI